MISAKVIADSKNEFGNRITTMVVTFPRIILAEFNTHRMFSRNSASSRAIPARKMIEAIKEHPFVPIAWQKDHPGMQGTEYFTDKSDLEYLNEIWLKQKDLSLNVAALLNMKDATKQICNRLLEPFMYHTVIVTTTEWENFFHLRCPQYKMINSYGTHYFRSRKDYLNSVGLPDEPDNYKNWTDVDWLKINGAGAEIHMMDLAEKMWNAYNESDPKELKAGEWHIPFGGNIDSIALKAVLNPSTKPEDFAKDAARMEKEIPMLMVKIATARCARVSYTVVGEEGKTDNYENDVKLHDRLAASGHWSPMEHCAMAMGNVYAGFVGGEEQSHKAWSGNFKGFIQYRKTFENENVTK